MSEKQYVYRMTVDMMERNVLTPAATEIWRTREGAKRRLDGIMSRCEEQKKVKWSTDTDEEDLFSSVAMDGCNVRFYVGIIKEEVRDIEEDNEGQHPAQG